MSTHSIWAYRDEREKTKKSLNSIMLATGMASIEREKEGKKMAALAKLQIRSALSSMDSSIFQLISEGDTLTIALRPQTSF